MNSNLTTIAVDLIDANPFQPREDFVDKELEELAGSIESHGLIQPILVHAAENGRFTLHHGERRLRAFKLLGKETIPAIVKAAEAGDEELLITALMENMQRVDMNPIEEAKGIAQLRDLGRTQEEIARALGISVNRISSRLRWLQFGPEIQALVAEKMLPSDRKVAKAFAGINSKEGRMALAMKLAGQGRTIKSIVRAASIYSSLEAGEKVSGNYQIGEDGHLRKKYQEKQSGRRRSKNGLSHAVAIVYDDQPMKLPAGDVLSELVMEAIDSVCTGCYLFEYDPDLPCMECPLTKMLGKLAEGVKV